MIHLNKQSITAERPKALVLLRGRLLPIGSCYLIDDLRATNIHNSSEDPIPLVTKSAQVSRGLIGTAYSLEYVTIFTIPLQPLPLVSLKFYQSRIGLMDLSMYIICHSFIQVSHPEVLHWRPGKLRAGFDILDCQSKNGQSSQQSSQDHDVDNIPLSI